MRKYPQQRHPSPRTDNREDTAYGRRLRRVPLHSEQTPVSTGSDSFASTAGTLSEEYELDVDVLEEIERGYYENLQQQQNNQLLLEAEDDDPSRSDLPYLVSGSVSRDSAANSELRQHSRRPESKSRRRTGDSGYKQRRRKTRVTEESLHPDEDVYHVGDENSRGIIPAIEDTSGHSEESVSNSDAMNPNRHRQTKTHRRKSTKSTKDASARHSASRIGRRNTTRERDGNNQRGPDSPQRYSDSSSHSSGPHAIRYAILQEIFKSMLMGHILLSLDVFLWMS